MKHIYKYFAYFTPLLFSVSTRAVTQVDDAGAQALPGLSTNLIDVTINLGLVLAAIILFAWIFKRTQGFGQQAAGSVSVLAALPLSQKERILLVQVGVEQFVVGASSAGLSTLHVMKEPVQTITTPNEESSSFKEKLLQSLRGAQS